MLRLCKNRATRGFQAADKRVFKPILLAHNVHRVAQSSVIGLSLKAGKLPEFIRLQDAAMLAPEMHLAKRACKLGPSTGVPFDDLKPSRIDILYDID